jgi:site-specific DNA recombinase
VSSEEQIAGYSLDAQDRAGNGYCDAHDWDLVAVYRDEGKSARTDDLAKRPDFLRMLEDAEAGLFDVVIVHKLDRFARNLRVTLETLERLNRSGVGFVSISENMDFASPIGKVILATLAAFAQYYSDNLSFETKKGKAERKAQGLYNGLLPFGIKRSAVKNAEGVLVPNPQAPPVPDPETYPGLLLAFQLSAEGKSDRDVAEALNAAGYRTTGNRGRNPFTKDTIRRVLLNRFYLGELPDGQGRWLPGAHAPVLDPELFERAQGARAANMTNLAALSVPRAKRTHSLSGLLECGRCGGRLHVETKVGGKTRVYCYQRIQTDRCPQRSSTLDAIETDVVDYLRTFRLPNDEVGRIITILSESAVDHGDAEGRRKAIGSRLERIAELYKWGDMTREAYVAERDRLTAERATLGSPVDQGAVLRQTAEFLRNLPSAWEQATPEQRNALARLVLASVEVTDGTVTAITPTPEFAPFFNARNSDAAPESGGVVKLQAERAEATGIARAVPTTARGFHHSFVRCG